MKRIKLSGLLDPECGEHEVGPGLYAINDGTLEEGCWDLRMSYADNVIGTDYGDGLDVEVRSVDGLEEGLAWAEVANHDGIASFVFGFAIEERLLVEE